jgi:hypothetical protein
LRARPIATACPARWQGPAGDAVDGPAATPWLDAGTGRGAPQRSISSDHEEALEGSMVSKSMTSEVMSLEKLKSILEA